jgi:hypothetical protein
VLLCLLLLQMLLLLSRVAGIGITAWLGQQVTWRISLIVCITTPFFEAIFSTSCADTMIDLVDQQARI